jgi:hypothetical protein
MFVSPRLVSLSDSISLEGGRRQSFYGDFISPRPRGLATARRVLRPPGVAGSTGQQNEYLK